MDIIIKDPIYITFETTEFDNNLPSVKFNIFIQIDKFTHSCNFVTTLWFECDEVDKFISSLHKNQLTSIHDISNQFELVLDPESCTLEWLFRCDNVDLSTTNMCGSEKLTLDMYSSIGSSSFHVDSWG